MKRFIEGERSIAEPRCSRSVWTTRSPRTIRCGSSMCSSTSSTWRSLGFEGAEPRPQAGPRIIRRRCSRSTSTATSTACQSSRRLERETQRNLELIWLTGRLDAGLQDDRRLPPRQRRRPSAGCAGSSSCCAGSSSCSREAMVAIDGSKFKAVNNRDKNFTAAQAEGAHGAARAEHRALPGGPRSGRSRTRRGARGSGSSTEGEDRDAQAADAASSRQIGAQMRQPRRTSRSR